MSTANLTTKEAAKLLNVSEATVKRWADHGVLQPEKTVGGHRRFSIQAIARIRRERGLAAQKDLRLVTANKSRVGSVLLSPASLVELLLRGAEGEVTAALIDAYLSNHSLTSLFDHTITKAMHEIGELWLKGSITVADEHLSTRTVLNALQKLRSIVVPAEPLGLKAICCGIEGDLHELPVHLVEIILECDGWEVMNLGPNTPLFSLGDKAGLDRPDLVCISARSIVDIDRATLEYVKLQKITHRIGAVLVLGGEAFREPTLRIRFPAGFYGHDFTATGKFFKTLAKKRLRGGKV